jgi:hypothetical protein
MPLQIAPLAEEQKLNEAMPGHRLGEFAPAVSHGCLLTEPNRFRPLQPTHSPVSFL